MESAHNVEWSKAQQINFSVDLLETAKQQLKFLTVVDATSCLYDGPALERAIHRYKYCWLPLLAKHVECSVVEGPLVVPLDCEWVWHCHRLNPVKYSEVPKYYKLQYKRDCEVIFGRILDKIDVLSTVGENISNATELVWNKTYVSEPFHLDLDRVLSQALLNKTDTKTEKSTTYDLAAAVKRQSSFFSKVSKMIGYDDCFLEEAIARYKSFLNLSKMIMERNIDYFCVPTHDIDLIWHTHQLYPAAYCKDLETIFGKVLDHNDRDFGSSESGNNNLKLMFLKTKEHWEDTCGYMYCVEGPKQHKTKNGDVRCCLDHVPGLGAFGNDQPISEKHAFCVGMCILVCHLQDERNM